jgi:hypothetical protein
MSTRSAKTNSANNPPLAEAIEVRLKGPGITTLGLIDGKGNLLLSRRVAVSGSTGVELTFQMPLSLSTKKGEIAAVPMLFHQTSATQLMTIGGKNPAAAAEERQRALKLNAAAVGKIKAAAEAAAAQIRETGRLTSPVTR